MNPRLVIMFLAAVILGAGYYLLKNVNLARAERENTALTSSTPAGNPEKQPPKTESSLASKDPEPSETVPTPEPKAEPEVEVEPVYPDLGFNDPLLLAAESSLRMSVDVSQEKLGEPVATVNGESIFYRDLVTECILRYGMSQTVPTVISEYVVISELNRRAMPIEPDPAKTDDEVKRFLREKYQGKILAQVLADIHFTEDYFRLQVMLQRAAEDLYKIDEEDGELPDPFAEFAQGPTKKRHGKWKVKMERLEQLNQTKAAGGGLREFNAERREKLRTKSAASHPLFMQIWMQDLLTRHVIENEAKDLPQDVFARVDGVPIDMATIAPRLLLSLTEGQRYEALDNLIQRRLLEQTFEENKVRPDMKRVNLLYSGEKSEFKGSIITWEMYLQWENSNPALYKKDMQTFDCIDQIQGTDIPDETLVKYYEDNKIIFGFGGRRVSHILLSAIDEKTGLPRGESAYVEALARAEAVKKELESGKDFFDLVMRFSDDKETKKYATLPNTKIKIAGDLGIVQPRDRKVDKAIVRAAYKLDKGNTGGPILTQKGYHFIKVTNLRDPKETTYEEVSNEVRREFLRERREAFIEDLRNTAQVKILFGDGFDPWAVYQTAKEN